MQKAKMHRKDPANKMVGETGFEPDLSPANHHGILPVREDLETLCRSCVQVSSAIRLPVATMHWTSPKSLAALQLG